MNFKIERDVLLENLNIVAHALPAKTPMPVLTNIKFDVFENEIKMTSSNNDLSIEVSITKNIEITETGSCLLPGKYLIEIIKKITGKKVSIQKVEDKLVVIKADRSEYKLHLYDYYDYPTINFIVTDTSFEMDAKTFKNIIKETNYATATNEKKPILTGVLFKFDEESITCTATDSFRLAQKIVYLKVPFMNNNVVIPNRALDELFKTIELYNETLEIFVSNNKILFKFKNILFQSRLLEGNYPETSRLIPNEFPTEIKFNKEELLGAIDRVSIITAKDKDQYSNIIKLSLRKDQIVEITSNNSTVGDAKEEVIPSDTATGVINIAFSSKYLIDALKSFTSNEVKLSFTGETKPFIVRGEFDANLTTLILPVRID